MKNTEFTFVLLFNNNCIIFQTIGDGAQYPRGGVALDNRMDSSSRVRQRKTEYLGRDTGACGIFLPIAKTCDW